MSAYFESLNRRVSTPPAATAAAPAIVPAPAPAPEVEIAAKPRRIVASVQRLAPGAVPLAYAMLRERLLVAAGDKQLKSLVFAGCDGSEGCTTIVREFAESLASAGLNVLLVDADLPTAGLTTSLAARGADLVEPRPKEGGATGDRLGTRTIDRRAESGGGTPTRKRSFDRPSSLFGLTINERPTTIRFWMPRRFCAMLTVPSRACSATVSFSWPEPASPGGTPWDGPASSSSGQARPCSGWC